MICTLNVVKEILIRLGRQRTTLTSIDSERSWECKCLHPTHKDVNIMGKKSLECTYNRMPIKGGAPHRQWEAYSLQIQEYQREIFSELSESSNRFCGFLDTFMLHQESVKQFPGSNSWVCVVCSGKTSKCCIKCGKALHMGPPEGDNDTKVSCFTHYHNTSFFGLARDDCRIVRKRQHDWSFPSTQQWTVGSTQMKNIHSQHVARKNFVAANSNDDGSAAASSNINDID